MMLVRGETAGLTGKLVQLAEPWSKLFSHSKPVSAGVLFFHLAPLIFAAGVAFAADRATLRAAKGSVDDRVRQLQELAGTHRLVLTGLTVSFISGIMLFLSDVENFIGSPFYWIKLSCVALLLVNGVVMTRTEKSLAGSGTNAPLWGRLRTVAVLSAILWFATALAGVVLKEFA